MKEIDPILTSRNNAFENWINAPQPMVTFIKTFNVKNLVKITKSSDLKFNMLLCFCIGKAASKVREFFLLPVDKKLYKFEKLAINVIVKTKDNTIHSCDIPFNNDLKIFNEDYLNMTKKVFDSNTDNNLEDYMVIGTSNIKNIYIDGAINVYSGIFNNPYLVWGKYKRKKNKIKLPISFQFHHSQMDGREAGDFLNNLKKEIKQLKV